MKVRVVLTVDVDVDAWREAYEDCADFSAGEIREAVRGSTLDAALTAGIVVPEGIIVGGWLEGQAPE